MKIYFHLHIKQIKKSSLSVSFIHFNLVKFKKKKNFLYIYTVYRCIKYLVYKTYLQYILNILIYKYKIGKLDW